MSEHNSDLVEFDTGKTKWNAQQLGVNSDMPLMDMGTGQKYIVRQFLFDFNLSLIKQIQEKKIPAPTHQDLFNSVWPQIKVELWKDGIVAVQEKEYPPKIVVGKKRFKVIMTCIPRMGVIVNERTNKLQDVLKPKSLTAKR